jgi:ribosomal protein S18 acetylase RimI-like enzyme
VVETTIRPYRPQDRAAVYDVCIRTGDAGGDARGLYVSDDLMPDAFAGPYLELEPDLVFVLDAGGRAVGYVLGCADTAAFVAAVRGRWLPLMTGKYPPEASYGGSDWLVRDLYHPERMLLPELAGYPAHLHIDVLPEHQGAGHGRALIETFLAAAARRGSPALHLGVAPANRRALSFYDHLGFRPIPITSREVGAVFLGRPTST